MKQKLTFCKKHLIFLTLSIILQVNWRFVMAEKKDKTYTINNVNIYFDINKEYQDFLLKYDISNICELEEGMLFGLMPNQINIYYLTPEYSYNTYGNFINVICGRNINVLSTKDFLLKEDRFKPLIFQKLNDNRIQELLSGKIFWVVHEEYNLNFSQVDSLKDFQDKIKQYSKENLVISQIENNTLVVNDKLKAIYIEETLPHREKFIKSLEEVKQLGDSSFKEGLQEMGYEIQSIAEFDNMIYDMKRKRKIK